MPRGNHAPAAIGVGICRDRDCPARQHRGRAVADSNGAVHADPWWRSEPAEWARVHRRGLRQGFELHQRDRGLLPGALVEEIRARPRPPLPGDAQLARWSDGFVPSPEPVRSYARPFRRRHATPDIPLAP